METPAGPPAVSTRRMTQTQPQHQPQAQPESATSESQVDGRADVGAPVAEHLAAPTYQQIEAFGYQRFTNREQSRLDWGSRPLDLAEGDGPPLLGPGGLPA